METKEEKNKTYWDKERLEKFWGRNPTQEFNDRIETQDDIQLEFQSTLFPYTTLFRSRKSVV